jgi:hypothetical protein
MSLVRALLLAAVSLVVLLPVTLHAQDAPSLDHARQLYNESRFSDAIGEIETLLRQGAVRGDQMTTARELRARCLAKLGRRLEAQEAYLAILQSDASYRADPVVIPPDEMEPFRNALRKFQAEQVRAGRRFPASVGLLYGAGQAVNQDLVDLASTSGAGEAPDFEASKEFGYSVRFPLQPRLSIDLEVTRLRADTQDAVDPSLDTHASYQSAAIPIVASGLYNLISNPKWRLNGFAGAGPMQSEATVEFLHNHLGRLIPVQIVGRKTGVYLHAGLEGEYLLIPRFAVTGRFLARYANSGELDWKRPDFEVYEGFPASKLGGRAVDFSGLAFHAGIRAYIGY